MKKELVEKYLSTKSLEDLEQSKVATILIAGRAQVAEYDKAQAEVMKDYDAYVLRLDSLQADLEKLLAATFMQRVFKIKKSTELFAEKLSTRYIKTAKNTLFDIKSRKKAKRIW